MRLGFVGTVSNAAAGLKDRVAGIYSGTGETGNTATAGEGLSKGATGVLYEDEVSFCHHRRSTDILALPQHLLIGKLCDDPSDVLVSAIAKSECSPIGSTQSKEHMYANLCSISQNNSICRLASSFLCRIRPIDNKLLTS